MVHGEIAFVQQILVRTVWQVLAVFLQFRAVRLAVKDVWFTPRKFGSSNLSQPTRDTWRSHRCKILVNVAYRGLPYCSLCVLKRQVTTYNELQILYGSIYKTGSLLCGKRFVPMQYQPRLTTEDWNVLFQLWTDRREAFLLW